MEYKLIAPRDKDLSITEQIFKNRGITDIHHYLNLTVADTYSEELLDNLKDGAKLLIKHIKAMSPTVLIVDCDTDGFTSASLLYNYLYKLFPTYVDKCIAYKLHEGKEHGIEMNMIAADTKFLIVPDAGSSDLKQWDELKKLGIETLILDHHNSDLEPNNSVVRINNQTCDYPNKSFSGVGIVYKFCKYLDKLLRIDNADYFLDLVAIGNIADMMSLKEYETTYYIRKGLKEIHNPFIEKMIEKQNFSIQKHGQLDPFSVSFYIAPQINATIRVGENEEKQLLFESMLENKAYNFIPSTKRGQKGAEELLVEQVIRNCNNIKNRQTKLRDKSLLKVENLIARNDLLKNEVLVIKLEPEMKVEKTLTGLVANILMSKYKKPVMLLNKVVHSDNSITWEGSCRGYEKSRLISFQNFLKESELVEYANGHDNAFGAGVTDSNLKLLIEYINKSLKGYFNSSCYMVDEIYQGGNFNGKDIISISDLNSVWGQSVDEPYIAIERFNITKGNIQLLSRDKNPTLKITLPNGVSIMKFKSSEEEFNSLYSENGCVTVNIVGKASKNSWNGTVTPQILTEEMEIVGSSNYYF